MADLKTPDSATKREARPADETVFTRPRTASLHARRSCPGLRLRPRRRLPRRISLHPRRAGHHVPRPPLDHAPVRRHGRRRGVEQALQISARATARPASRWPSICPPKSALDSDNPLALGEVGKVGVAIDSIEDMQRLFDGIDLTEISTSMTINATASILLALYVAVARRQGADIRKLSGTVQNDVLKEYIARGTYIYPPQQAMRIITDIFAWTNENVPEWNTISISGYHMREAGSTAVQEVAFTLGNGIAYVEAAHRRRPRRRQVRAAALLLLQRAQQFPRRGREVPRRAPHVGEDHARPLQGEEPKIVDAALPHADRRFHADRAAAGEQHRAHGDSGHGRRARRNAISAHQFL